MLIWVLLHLCLETYFLLSFKTMQLLHGLFFCVSTTGVFTCKAANNKQNEQKAFTGQRRRRLKMDLKIFKAISCLSGRMAFMDFLMILLSNRARYLFLFVLACMWMAKGPSRTSAKKAAAASLIAIFVNKVLKICYFRPRPFITNKVGLLIPAKRDSSFPSKHTVVSFAASIVIFYGNRFIGRILLWVSACTGFAASGQATTTLPM